MSGNSPVILILGAGPRVGHAVALKFASQGYKVALAARSIKEADSTDSQLNIPSDFANTNDIARVFSKTREILGVPSVVFYNASSGAPSSPDDPLAVSLAQFSRDMSVNATSVFVAAQKAVEGFAELPSSAARTFFYTGNILNVKPIPSLLSAGAGKSASAHMMMAAATAYKERGFRFYYVDERKADGSAAFKIDGEAHAKLLWDLAEAKTQGPWLQTFVKDNGYTAFDGAYGS